MSVSVEFFPISPINIYRVDNCMMDNLCFLFIQNQRTSAEYQQYIRLTQLINASIKYPLYLVKSEEDYFEHSYHMLWVPTENIKEVRQMIKEKNYEIILNTLVSTSSIDRFLKRLKSGFTKPKLKLVDK